jgi:hypothetical protein
MGAIRRRRETYLTTAAENVSLSHVVARGMTIFAIGWFIALGSGLVEYAHNAQHAREDAALAQARGHSAPDVPIPVHNDSNCAVHAQLHAPAVSQPVVTLLIFAGLLVAFVTQLATPLVSVRIPARIDCRGPPAC